MNTRSAPMNTRSAARRTRSGACKHALPRELPTRKRNKRPYVVSVVEATMAQFEKRLELLVSPREVRVKRMADHVLKVLAYLERIYGSWEDRVEDLPEEDMSWLLPLFNMRLDIDNRFGACIIAANDYQYAFAQEIARSVGREYVSIMQTK